MKSILFLMLFVVVVMLATVLILPRLDKRMVRRVNRQARSLAGRFMMALQEALVLPARLWSRLRYRNREVCYGANIAEGVHERSITKLPDAAIAARHLLFKVGSDADHIAACGVADVPIGTIADECTAAELATGNHFLSVELLGKGPTKRMVASEAITAGEQVFTAAGGKVQDTPAGATVYLVGVALTAAGADNDIIEVADCAPVKFVFA